MQSVLLRVSGQSEHGEILNYFGKFVECVLRTDCGQRMQCAVLTDRSQAEDCEVLTGFRQVLECEELTEDRLSV